MIERPATPEEAAGWLASWRALGGGVTIGADGRVYPWWLPRAAQTADSQLAERVDAMVLLSGLVVRPELITAIRAVVGSEAERMLHRALKTMGKEDR